jgi:nitroreductase/NAD-dependent dihydropyrimidine dehydrogenase PreA subunit
MLKIDDIKCKRCLKCISECPTISLDYIANKTVQIDPSICLACGHCISACIHNAISLNERQKPQPFSLTDFDYKISQVSDVFIKTRSVRKFKQLSIDKEIISRIISDAEMAPSGDNLRKREYIVVNNAEIIDKMETLLANYYKNTARFLSPIVIRTISIYSKSLAKELKFAASIVKSIKNRKLENKHTIFRDAPCVIFILGLQKSMLAKDDCIAAQNYMRLSATMNGIGSCIVGFAQESKGVLEKFLNVDQDKRIYAATIFGYQENDFLKRIKYFSPPIKWM